MAMVVHRPALASPTDKNGLSVTDFFTEKLKTSNIVLVPPSFEFSAQCAFWVLRWPCGQNGPVYATGPYYVAHVVDTGP